MYIGLHGIKAEVEYQREMMEWLAKHHDCSGMHCSVGWSSDYSDSDCPLSRNGNRCRLGIENRVRAAIEWLDNNRRHDHVCERCEHMVTGNEHSNSCKDS